jgi:hypothetical protein
MRVFIYELVSAGGLGADVPASLRQEGAAMLRAVVEDFERVLGVKTLTLLANDFPESIGRDCRRVGDADESRAFRYLAVQADVALIIAPEFDNLLAGRTGWAVAAGCRLLGCNYDAIRLTGDKLRLALGAFPRRRPCPHRRPGRRRIGFPASSSRVTAPAHRRPTSFLHRVIGRMLFDRLSRNARPAT